MADNSNPTGHGHPAMDYAEHERTYNAFLRVATIGSIWTLTIIVGMAIGVTGKAWLLGTFMIVVSTVAAGVGIAVRSLSHKPVSVVLGLMLVIWLFRAA
jgi:hypothetical protein